MFDKRLHRQKRPFEPGPEAALINTFMNTFESPLSCEQRKELAWVVYTEDVRKKRRWGFVVNGRWNVIIKKS